MPAPFDPAAVEAFHHRGWDYDVRTGEIVLRYALDDLGFEERFGLPEPRRVQTGAAFEQAAEVLHLCAGTSYFKAAAPPVVTGVPSWLVGFAERLYLHGLAEFAMANDLDPVRPAFEARAGSGGGDGAQAGAGPGAGPALVAIGGGKDSIVSAESLVRTGRRAVLASVSTHRAIEEAAAITGLAHLVVQRAIDPRLLELNQRGARNGHIPVTAITSAALALLAAGHGAGAVVMSNESSASVPIAEHRGMPVNHQWSKSLECEAALAALLPVPYFSLLRPLHEVEICRRFAGLRRYFGVVTSCNQAYTATGRVAGVRWCGQCPKCRFVFLGLAPFLAPEVLVGIFEGHDLLADAAGVEAYRSILGLGGPPPMECVGTTHESRWAMARLAETPAWRDRVVVRALIGDVDLVAGWDPLAERGPHRIPDAWLEVADALA